MPDRQARRDFMRMADPQGTAKVDRLISSSRQTADYDPWSNPEFVRRMAAKRGMTVQEILALMRKPPIPGMASPAAEPALPPPTEDVQAVAKAMIPPELLQTITTGSLLDRTGQQPHPDPDLAGILRDLIMRERR